MNLVARDYQTLCVDAIFREWKEVNSTMIDVATGAGKTSIFNMVIVRAFPRRALVINNRKNLVMQTAKRVREETSLTVEVEMGEYKASNSNDLLRRRSQVIVTSLQTQTVGGDGGGRMSKFDPKEFGVLIYDECHGAVSESAKRMVNYYRSNSGLWILGVTATPDRFDEEALGQIFETCAFQYPIYDPEHSMPNGIDDGWLVPVVQEEILVNDLDISKVRTTAGDLNGADLAKVLEAEKPLQEMVMATFEKAFDLPEKSLLDLDASKGEWAEFARKNGKPKRSLGFTCSVRHAQMFSNILNRAMPGLAAWVCGKTPDDDRIKIDSDFKSGKIQILLNCNTHGEGFDCPDIENVFMYAMTKSRARYAQRLGRGTRVLPGIVDGIPTAKERRVAISLSKKPCVRIYDFAGNSGKHKLIRCLDVLGGTVSDDVVEAAIIKMRSSRKPVQVAELLEEELEASKQRKVEEEARKARLVLRSNYTSKEINPFDILAIKPVKQRAWDNNKQLSEKQNGFLKKFGINPDKLQYGEAKQLIGELLGRMDKGLCTIKQAALLKKHGYDTQMTFEDAGATIDRLAKNGWRKPLAPVWKSPVKEVANSLHEPLIDSDIPF